MKTSADFDESTPFLPVADGRTQGTTFNCALCGTRFTHGRQSCGSCPLNRGCQLVTCPSCGYSFPRSSTIVNWVRAVLARVRSNNR